MPLALFPALSQSFGGPKISGGVLCVVGVLLCGLLLPRFVSYDARQP